LAHHGSPRCRCLPSERPLQPPGFRANQVPMTSFPPLSGLFKGAHAPHRSYSPRAKFLSTAQPASFH
jgi:hypothetical protein